MLNLRLSFLNRQYSNVIAMCASVIITPQKLQSEEENTHKISSDRAPPLYYLHFLPQSKYQIIQEITILWSIVCATITEIKPNIQPSPTHIKHNKIKHFPCQHSSRSQLYMLVNYQIYIILKTNRFGMPQIMSIKQQRKLISMLFKLSVNQCHKQHLNYEPPSIHQQYSNSDLFSRDL